jgi:ammonium transporter Rh
MNKNYKRNLFNVTFLAIFQIAFIILMGIFGSYDNTGQNDVPTLYAMFIDVHTMMFIGFGFLMTFLKRYGYGATGLNFLIAAFVLEWSLLVRGWLNDSNSIKINIGSLLVADFCAAAVLISFGAVIGKASISQLIVMTTIEVVVQSVNYYICFKYLKAYDIGESMYVHAFGAYFGLTVAKVLNHSEVESEKESSNYNSDLFSMIGTLFLFIYWPSFNSAGAKDEGRMRAIASTYLSIASSCITTFIISSLVGKGKLNMVHIQNSTLAGGVAIGCMADMAIPPYAAMIIGSIAGIVSTFGFEYLTPLLKKIRLHDTCGVNNLHGMPGLISGIGSSIVAALATRDSFQVDGDKNRLYVYYPSRIPVFNSTEYFLENLQNSTFSNGGDGRSAMTQGGYQIAALCLTLGLAVSSGLITGFLIKLPFFEKIKENDELFEDQLAWILPNQCEIDATKNNEKN